MSSIDNIINILRSSARQQYNSKQIDATNEIIENNVRALFEQDYGCHYISNVNGELSTNYPRRILVPVVDKWSTVQTAKIQASVDIRDLCVRSCFARCRSRLVAPAIFVEGRYICRSATLSSWGEIYPRFSMDLLVDATSRRSVPSTNNTDETLNDIEQPQQRSVFDKLRGADIDLLKIFDIGSIVNLMVQEKNLLFGLKITATEKSDKYDRYRTFQLISLPYPGCEHFREVAAQKYNSEFILHDWSLSKNAAILEVPNHLSSCVDTDWSTWRSWSTIHLTQNYMQLFFRHLEKDKRGILIHCLSGWDRTPLFISLLRLSLWADCAIHQSLTVEEIIYLTLAYDWYLFGHNLPERLAHGEEILYFTFMVLPHLIDDRFIFRPSMTPRQHATTEINDIHSNLSQSHSVEIEQDKKKVREEKLLAVFHVFHTCYRNIVPANSTMLNNRPIGSVVTRKIKNFLINK
ncbi:unnamed protein product [Rotaria magnacalcarata]|uniref:Myotubularin phosphatase domain-containing protein n=4 Tax=Rotaria magnacalcarata TaxID=392030 RepID=A0A814YMG6_9BILA|nr:unnamed protein product [Rotaria magnacalcarata]CAF1430083.1 unnamed protein product [Rotaria magnacalcarata]CAF3980956.1 unnamed protein product [Rotaria magnacalcarata]